MSLTALCNHSDSEMRSAHIFFSFVALAGVVCARLNAPPSSLSRRSVTCLTVGTNATATWTDATNRTCTFNGIVGSNYGENASDGEYVFWLRVV